MDQIAQHREKHQTPWQVWKGPLRPAFPNPIVEILDRMGRVVIPWQSFDHLSTMRAKLALARRIVLAVNAEKRVFP